mgnify:FL=1
MTQAVLANVEAAIRRAPEQWFWYNKRWVLTPVRDDAPAAHPAPDDVNERNAHHDPSE